MKTKTLLAAGLLMAATALNGFAQTVYSVNAVGFVNKTFRASGFTLAANPLNAADNRVSVLFAGAPDGSLIYTFNPTTGGFVVNGFDSGVWDNPNATLVPGQAFFFKNPSSTPYVNTFVGNVQQGVGAQSLKTSLGIGFSLVSSQVPQQGLVRTDLGFPAVAGDLIFKFNPTTISYQVYSFDDNIWTGPTGIEGDEPLIDVAEGFFTKKAVAVVWSRDFSVSQ